MKFIFTLKSKILWNLHNLKLCSSCANNSHSSERSVVISDIYMYIQQYIYIYVYDDVCIIYFNAKGTVPHRRVELFPVYFPLCPRRMPEKLMLSVTNCTFIQYEYDNGELPSSNSSMLNYCSAPTSPIIFSSSTARICNSMQFGLHICYLLFHWLLPKIIMNISNFAILLYIQCIVISFWLYSILLSLTSVPRMVRLSMATIISVCMRA